MIALWMVAACASPLPQRSLTWREAWEVLALTEDGGVLDLRVVVGNTGLLRGQGRVHLLSWSPHEGPIELSVLLAPQEVRVSPDHTRVGLGPWSLGETEEGWAFDFQDELARARLRLRGEGAPGAESTWLESGGQWRSAAPMVHARVEGAVTAEQRGGPLNGTALVLHRGGDGIPSLPRQMAVALDPRWSVGIDRHGGGQLAWAWIDGRSLSVEDARLVVEGTDWSLDLRPAADLVLEARLSAVLSERPALAHLLLPERALAAAADLGGTRRLTRGRGELRFEGRTEAAVVLGLELL